MEKLIRETKNFSVRNISNLCKHAYQNACIKKEPISRKHLMQELNAEKQKLALQSAPTKEEQEEWDKWENRWIGRGNIFINFLNLVLHAAAKRA